MRLGGSRSFGEKFGFLTKYDYISFSYVLIYLTEMRYTEIRQNLEKLQVFGIADLKILDDKFNKSKLSVWKKAGYLRQVIR